MSQLFIYKANKGLLFKLNPINGIGKLYKLIPREIIL